MQIAIVSDTHIPTRASEIPGRFSERIEAAAHVLHAGDFDSKGAFERMRASAEALTAVAGNMDPAMGLPEVATVELGGVEFVLTHGTGSHQGYERRVTRAVREHAGEDAVGVAGHTHEPCDTDHGGVRVLNPGTVTGASPGEAATMMTATVEDGTLDVELHRR